MLSPLQRERLHQVGHHDVIILPPFQNGLDDGRCQQGQAQHPADIGAVDLLCLRQVGQVGVLVCLQQPLPTMGTGERLDQPGARGWDRWSCGSASGRICMTAPVGRKGKRTLR